MSVSSHCIEQEIKISIPAEKIKILRQKHIREISVLLDIDIDVETSEIVRIRELGNHYENS